jgi:RHS repeat-associated protein
MLLVYREEQSNEALWLPEAGPRWPLARLGDGTFRIDDPLVGITRHFVPCADGTARIATVTDRNANRITFDYDDAGAPLAIRHSGGYHLSLATAEGRVTALMLVGASEDGTDLVVKRYGYTDGNLTEVTNSSGLALRFTYDERLRVTSWTDRNHIRYSYTYDDMDRCIAQGGESGYMTGTFTYDGTDSAWPGCRITTHTSADGAVTRFVVNDNSQVIAEVDALGGRTRVEYDEHHHLLSRTDSLGNTTRFENNSVGRPTRVVLPDGGVLTSEYNELQLPIRVVQPDGKDWEHCYDDRGNRVSSRAPDGAVTRFGYDDRGGLAAVTDPLGATTRVQCNPAGLRTQTVSALGERSVRVHDPLGRISSVTDPLGHTTRVWWTVEGRMLRVDGPDGSQETWTYDGEGNCTSHTGPGGARTSFEYGPFDLLTARTGPDGGRYEFAYDSALHLTQVTNPLGLNWQYTYDSAGRVVAETDFDERRTVYERNVGGELARKVNPAGQEVSYSHDTLGRLRTKTVGDATTVYSYDAMGRLARATGPDCDLLFERDHAGRIIAEQANGRTLTSSYDAAGRRIERVTPGGAHTRYVYDAVGRKTRLTSSDHTVDFAYDAVGQETGRLIDGSLRFDQSWDVNGRPREQRWAVADDQIQNRTYSYGADRHLVQFTDTVDGLIDLDVDVMGRVRAVQGDDRSENYTYDLAGHMIFASSSGHRGMGAADGDRIHSGHRLDRAGAVHYTYDSAGRVVERRKTRLSRKPDVWRYVWDSEDRLTSLVTPDGTVWRYLYDPLGRRIAKEQLADDGHTVLERTDFTWDGPTLAEQTAVATGLPHPVTLTWDHDGLRPVTQTERLMDSTTQEEIDSRFFAIVTDLVGTPTELVDPQGTVAWRARRTVWGVTAWPIQSQAYTPLRFPGQYHDPESGLYYNFQRYYDPEAARYTTLDPLGLAPDPNPYGYVTNPFRQIDPFGLMSCDEDTVVLYHGSRNWSGTEFSLGHSDDLQRAYTPDTGVYLTDDFMRAATQYATADGMVVRTEVPRSFAESVYQLHRGPGGRQPEYFVNTQEGVDILNAGSPRVLPQGQAVMQWAMGQF